MASAVGAHAVTAHTYAAVRRVTDVVFLATVFTVTFTKLRWESAGGLVLADVLTALLLGTLAVEQLLHREARVPRTAVSILLIGGGLLILYSAGFVSASRIDGGPLQVAKGLTRFGLHFTLLAAGLTYLAWRPRGVVFRAAVCFCAGVTANALYALAQLAVHAAGGNLDAIVISPLTGRPARSLAFGLDKSPDVPRLTGLTADPNHLAIMLIVPLLLLLPLYVQLPSRDWRRLPLALLMATLVSVAAGTLSRSGSLGLVTGAAVVALAYRRRLWSRRLLVPVTVVGLVLLTLIATNPARSARVVAARVRIDEVSMSHVHQYEYVTRALATNAVFGIGLANFGRTYAPITGRENFGPHSFYLQSLAETGVAGTFAFASFLAYVALRLRAAARAVRDGLERALVVGLAAALVGTMAANIFYLTMTFYYFYVFLILVLAAGDVRRGG